MNSKKTANVSVIIPCYCCSDTIERALHSVAMQSMAPAEILLVDDASDDAGATIAILRHLCDSFSEIYSIPIRMIALQENGGPSGARNIAWNTAEADFIAFLDADDAWHPRKLEIQYTWMCAHPEVALSGHLSMEVDGRVLSAEVGNQWSLKPCNLSSMLFRNPLATRTVMMRRDVSLRFVAGKRYAEDYLLWLQSAASGLQVYLLDVVLAYSFKAVYGAGGLSGDLWCMERGVIDAFRRLYRDRSIGMVMYTAVSLFSFLKYLRRVFAVVWRHN